MSFIKRTKGELVFDLVNVVCMFLLCVIMLMPFWFVITGSFASETEFLQTGGLILWNKSISLKTYEFLIAEGTFIKSFLLSVVRLLIVVPYSVTLTVLLAYVISHEHLPGIGILMPILVFFMYFDGGMIPYLQTMKMLKLYDTYLMLILPTGCSVYYALIIRNFIKTIPSSLAESARLDGARETTILFRIILPLCKPAIATISLFVAVGNWNDWFTGIAYMRQDRILPLQTYLRKMVSVSQYDLVSWGADLRLVPPVPETLKMACIVLTTLPIVCVYPFVQKYFVKGLLIGSVKE